MIYDSYMWYISAPFQSVLLIVYGVAKTIQSFSDLCAVSDQSVDGVFGSTSSGISKLWQLIQGFPDLLLDGILE